MALPPGFTIRDVCLADRAKYTETLAALTTVGAVSEDDFAAVLAQWRRDPASYHPRVIVDENDQVVATGMLLVERKVIHGCGKVGHIEDIAVAKTHQGMRLGQAMIEALSRMAHDAGCYKVILDCSPENVGFYEKCGYGTAGVEMQKRFD